MLIKYYGLAVFRISCVLLAIFMVGVLSGGVFALPRAANWEVAYPAEDNPVKVTNAIEKMQKELTKRPTDIILHKKLGVYWHALAAGEKGVLSEAQNSEKMFDAALKLAESSKNSNNLLINNLRGWKGAAIAIKPKFNIPMIDIIRASSAGSRLMDRAVHDNPQDLELRFVRANTYIYYPPNLGKLKLVIEDINYLLSVSKGKVSEKDPSVLKLYVMLAYAFQQNKQNDQCKIYMDKIASLAPKSEFNKKVRELCSN